MARPSVFSAVEDYEQTQVWTYWTPLEITALEELMLERGDQWRPNIQQLKQHPVLSQRSLSAVKAKLRWIKEKRDKQKGTIGDEKPKMRWTLELCAALKNAVDDYGTNFEEIKSVVPCLKDFTVSQLREKYWNENKKERELRNTSLESDCESADSSFEYTDTETELDSSFEFEMDKNCKMDNSETLPSIRAVKRRRGRGSKKTKKKAVHKNRTSTRKGRTTKTEDQLVGHENEIINIEDDNESIESLDETESTPPSVNAVPLIITEDQLVGDESDAAETPAHTQNTVKRRRSARIAMQNNHGDIETESESAPESDCDSAIDSDWESGSDSDSDYESNMERNYKKTTNYNMCSIENLLCVDTVKRTRGSKRKSVHENQHKTVPVTAVEDELANRVADKSYNLQEDETEMASTEKTVEDTATGDEWVSYGDDESTEVLVETEVTPPTETAAPVTLAKDGLAGRHTAKTSGLREGTTQIIPSSEKGAPFITSKDKLVGNKSDATEAPAPTQNTVKRHRSERIKMQDNPVSVKKFRVASDKNGTGTTSATGVEPLLRALHQQKRAKNVDFYHNTMINNNYRSVALKQVPATAAAAPATVHGTTTAGVNGGASKQDKFSIPNHINWSDKGKKIYSKLSNKLYKVCAEILSGRQLTYTFLENIINKVEKVDIEDVALQLNVYEISYLTELKHKILYKLGK